MPGWPKLAPRRRVRPCALLSRGAAVGLAAVPAKGQEPATATPQEIMIARDEFKSADGKTLEWSKIATFEITIVNEETRDKLDLTSQEGHAVLQLIKMVD